MLELIKSLFPILLKALIITIVVEELCLLIMREKSAKIYLLCFVMNIITNITMNVALQYSTDYYTSLIIFEIAVFVIEGLLYFAINKKIGKAIIISLVCNIASLLIGTIL